jgi:Tol biopolymer transport system component/fibronectin type 3 domain-containing protein
MMKYFSFRPGILRAIKLLQVDDGSFESDPNDILSSDLLAQYNVHFIDVINTTQAKFVAVILQYRKGMQWQNGPFLELDQSDTQHFRWDSRSVDIKDVVAIRLMAEDELGRNIFTNEILFNPISNEPKFSIAGCVDDDGFPRVIGLIHLYEDLSSLVFQIKSDDDPSFPSWTNKINYSNSVQYPIDWSIPVDGFINHAYSYQLRIMGETISSKELFSNIESYPFSKPCDSSTADDDKYTLRLIVGYRQAGCNLVSNEASITPNVIKGILDPQPSIVHYFIKIADDYEILKSFDYATQGLGKILLDTSSYPEGSYPIKLTFDDDQSMVASEVLVVDHHLPTAYISYPSSDTPICPQKVVNDDRTCFNIDVEGVADDNYQVDNYRLYYSLKAQSDPDVLYPAMTDTYCVQSWTPIERSSAKSGKLGTWTTRTHMENDHSLYLQVVDFVGNKTCSEQENILIDTWVEVSLSSDKVIFSPNGDSFKEFANIKYEVNEYSEIDLYAYGPFPDQNINDTDLNHLSLFRTLLSGAFHLGGKATVAWDGTDESGQTGSDGWYRILVSATDICGNNSQMFFDIEIDNTPPETIISSPVADESINVLSFEIRGSVDDLNFESYKLEAIKSENPDQIILLAMGGHPKAESLLGVWNTYGLTGDWQLRLRARDSVGNEREVVTHVSLLPKVDLISALSIIPQSFSPNGDGVYDNATIDFDLICLCNVSAKVLDDHGNIVKVFDDLLSVADIQQLVWNGIGSNDEVVLDGSYEVVVRASLASNSAVFQEESVSVKVDNTLPEIKISSPVDQAFISVNKVLVIGDITDDALDEYQIDLSHGATTSLIDSGKQSRTSHTFSAPDNLGDGLYALDLTAVDISGNKKQEVIQFTLDRAPPEISILKPLPNSFFGTGQDIISFEGLINEQNFSLLQVKYGPGENPSQWFELFSTEQLPENPPWYEWNLANQTGIANGLYTLLFTVADKAGNKSEQSSQITIDRNPPDLSISSPAQSAYIHEQIDIIGSVSDYLLNDFQLSLAKGSCESGGLRWSPITGSDQAVENAKLSTLPLPATDGPYCIKLSASDQAGNTSAFFRDITVDTHPPTPPVLSGEYTPQIGAVLAWPDNPESDIAGYDIYSNGIKIATVLPNALTMTDSNLDEGNYSYRLKAFDLAGNESDFSNDISFLVDTTGPYAWLSFPLEGGTVTDLVDIKGSAYSDDLKEFRILIGKGLEPDNWNLVKRSPLSSQSQIMAQLDSFSYQDGSYTLKLEAEDVNGNVNSDSVVFEIDNSAPNPPMLSSVSVSGNEVNLEWLANNESDLAGYLLIRDHAIVNASGPVIGSLAPYLVDGTTYEDIEVPDGKFYYYLLAMDNAGNLSSPSNSLYADIDTRAPHMLITFPDSGYAFEESVGLEAESPDTDIEQVQFEYKAASEGSWHTLGQPDFQEPFQALFEPGKQGMPYDDYQIRAVATDGSGKNDSAPEYISITYTDLTPPNPPTEVQGRALGGKVSVSWAANTENDLAGYNFYYNQTSHDNSVPITGTTYDYPATTGAELSNGVNEFSVSAVDIYGNESEKTPVSVTIFTPQLTAPSESQTQDNSQIINGSTKANCSVDIFRTHEGVESQIGTVVAAGNGGFSFETDLLPGDNTIRVRASDASGNISKFSNMILISYSEPLVAPTGLTASVDNYVVNLNWEPNEEPILKGYHVYRDGVQLSDTAIPDLSKAITSGSSPLSSAYSTRMAYDGIASTAFIDNAGGNYPPAWWQLDFQQDVTVTQIEIVWYHNSSFEFSARDYEVQAWSGSDWETIQSVMGNTELINYIKLNDPVSTDKLRLIISSSNHQFSTSYVGLAEVVVTKDLPKAAYADSAVVDGVYQYQVSAYDTYNLESLLSEPLTVLVGDVVPPEAPVGLTYIVEESTVKLAWTPNNESDLVGYNVYRSSDRLNWNSINESPVTGITYDDMELLNGIYSYGVSAIDQAGNESGYSNLVEATIAKPLLVPQNLKVIALPVGQSLEACWDSLPGADGFIVYRTENVSGPYVRVSDDAVTGNCFTDSGLVNGTHYYYVVTSTDAIGNESDYSNEAGAVPVDEILPDKPALISPTIAGIPVVVPGEEVTIVGFSEPGTEADLYHNSHYYDSVQSSMDDDYRKVAINYVSGDFVPSPDGNYIAYNYYNDYVRIGVSTSSGYKTNFYKSNTSSFAWSYDSKLLAFIAPGATGANVIFLYDLGSYAATRLTVDVSVSESSPSWSRDGRIAFISDLSGSDQVWLKDFADGQLTQVTNSAAPELVEFAPDGEKILYVESGSLYVIDLLTRETVPVDDHLADDGTGQTVHWAPDSGRIAYVSDGAGYPDVYVYDLPTGDRSQVTRTIENEVSLSWSADGQQVLYVSEESTGGNIRSCSTVDGACESVRSENIPVDNLRVTPSGTIFYSDSGNNMYRLVPAGYFSFADVSLDPGENIFHAQAKDTGGNVSPESEPISVSIDPSIYPDVVAEAEDIILVPATPFVGEQVSIRFSLRNQSEVEAYDVPYDVYVLDPTNNLEHVAQGSIPVLPAHGEEVYAFTWDSTGKEGVNTIYVLADREEVVREANEENNIASSSFHVVSSEGIELSTRINGTQFHSNEYLAIDGELFNSGPDEIFSMDVIVEDPNGILVDVVDSIEVSVPFGQPYYFSLVWNSESVYAGDYQVRTVVKSGQDDLAEEVLPFTILPDIDLQASIDTDRLHYGANEPVRLNSRIANLGKNFIIPSLNTLLTVSSPEGEVFTKESQVSNLFNGDSINLTAAWNTANANPGEYTATVTLSYEGEVVAEDTNSFSIDPVLSLTGALGLSAKIVPIASPVGMSYTINSSGNIGGTGLTLNVTILDSDTQSIVGRKDLLVDMAANDSVSGTLTIAAEDLYQGHFKAILFHGTQEKSFCLADVNFTVTDTVPPIVELISPLSGSFFDNSPLLSVRATDNSAGVDSVEYRIDGKGWTPLPLIDQSTATYSSTWHVSEIDEGSHLIAYRAKDRNGNHSSQITSEITLVPRTDLTAKYPNSQYQINEDLNGVLTITNHGWAKTLQLQSWIEDSHSTIVHGFAPQTLQLGSDEVKLLNLDWNVGTTLAGGYTIHNQLSKADTILADQVSSIEVAPGLMLTSALQSDRTNYTLAEDVQLHLEVESGGNYTIPAAVAELVIADTTGNPVYTETQAIDAFEPGTKRSLDFIWNTAQNRAGTYSATVSLSVDALVKSSSSVSLVIEPVLTLGGSLTLTQSKVPMGENLRVSYTAGNTGNTLAQSLLLRLKVLDAGDIPVITLEHSIDLDINDHYASEEVIGTAALPIGTYRLVFEYDWQNVTAVIDETTFTVVDSTPPDIAVISPQNDALFDGPFDLSALVTDDGSEVADAEYRLNGGPWQPLSLRDGATGLYAYSWIPVEAEEGTHSVEFRAMDVAGNEAVSNPVTITIELCKPFHELTGTLSFRPQPLYYGQEVSFDYALTNQCRKDLIGVTANLAIIDPVTSTMVKSLSSTVNLEPDETAQKSVTLSTLDELNGQSYYAVLQIESADHLQRELADLEFDIQPALNVSAEAIDRNNLLVWTNYQCEPQCEDNDIGQYGDSDNLEDSVNCRNDASCMRQDLLERILDDATDSYRIVHERQEFEDELRNPLYSDILILGDQFQITDHLSAELREKIYSGTGLISSGWLFHEPNGAGNDRLQSQPVLGIKREGSYVGKSFRIRTVESPITDPGEFDTATDGWKIKADSDTVVVGWFVENSNEDALSPAIVLHEYGLGKTVYLAFDYGRNLTDVAFTQMSEILQAAMHHVHHADPEQTLYPYRLEPVNIRVESPGRGFDLVFKVTYPPDLWLYDPATMSWYQDGHWEPGLTLPPGDAGYLPFNFLAPDGPGTYNFNLQSFMTENNREYFLQSDTLTFDVPTSQDELLAGLIIDLESLDLSGGDRAKAGSAVSYLERVRYRTVSCDQRIEKNILDLEKAVETLIGISGIDITTIRLELDTLLRIEESRWYFYAGPDCDENLEEEK